MIFYMAAVVLTVISISAIIEITIFISAHIFFKDKENKIKAEKSVKIAVIIPAHNEEKNIERCIKSIKESEKGIHSVEVIVVADNCSDNTAKIAVKAGAKAIERFNEVKRGKGAALDYAFNLLKDEKNDAYIIIDADTVVDKNFIEVMGDQFSIGEEALQCKYLVLNKKESQKTRFMNLALLSMNVFRPNGREKYRFSVGIMGNGFGLSKKLIDEVPYSANSITEDLEYHLKLIESGKRVKFVKSTGVLADFPLSKEGNETQRARWEGGRFLLQRQFGPKLADKIFKGKTKLIEPFLELMTLPLSYEVIVLLLLLVIPVKVSQIYGIVGLFIIFIHLLMAVIIYGDKEDFAALINVPKYILWKIIKLPMIIATSKGNAGWVRTKRD